MGRGGAGQVPPCTGVAWQWHRVQPALLWACVAAASLGASFSPFSPTAASRHLRASGQCLCRSASIGDECSPWMWESCVSALGGT